MAEKGIKLKLDVDSSKGTASIKKTTTGLKKLGTDGTKAADKLSKSFITATAKMKLLAIGIAASITAIGYMAKKTLDSADATAKLADSLGYSIKLMQEYSYAAGLSGVAQGTLNSSMLAFAKRLGEAKAGTGALVTYLKKTDKALLNQLTSTSDVNKALEIFMTALGNVKSSTDRAALASAAFSRAGIAMTVMVKDGGAGLRAMQKEAHDLGLVMGGELFRNAEKLNDSMSKISQVIRIMFTKAVLTLAPYIDEVVDKMVNWIKANQELIDQKTEKSINAITEAFETLASTLGFLAKHLKTILYIMGSLIGIKLLKWIAPIITGTVKWVGGTILQVAATRQLTTALIIAQGAVAAWLTKVGLGTVGILKFSGATIAGTVTLLAYAAALGVVYLAIEKLGAERLARWFGMPIENAKKFKAELDNALGVEIELTGQAKELALALKDADKYFGSMQDRGKQLALALKDPDKFFAKLPKPPEITKGNVTEEMREEWSEAERFAEERKKADEEYAAYRFRLELEAMNKRAQQLQDAMNIAKEYEEKKLTMIQYFNEQYNQIGKSRFDIEREQLAASIIAWQEAGIEKNRIDKLVADKTKAISKAENAQRLSDIHTSVSMMASGFQQISEMGGKHSKEAFAMYKGFKIIETIIATRSAAIKAYEALAFFPPAALAAAAAAVTFGMAQVATIQSAQPPSYDQGGISNARGIYQTGDIKEAHIPLPSGDKIPVRMENDQKPTQIIVKMENPVFQDVDTQRRIFAQIAEVIATRVAPNAVVDNYNNDGPIRQLIRGGR